MGYGGQGLERRLGHRLDVFTRRCVVSSLRVAIERLIVPVA